MYRLHISLPRLLLGLWLGLMGMGLPTLGAQCPEDQRDTLAWEDFEAGLPPDWGADRSTDGGRWHVDTQPIGYYENPGQGAWLYVNDESFNDVGVAHAHTPVYDLRAYDGEITASFDLLFQSYADSGRMQLEIWDGRAWTRILDDSTDFMGRITLDLSDFAGHMVQLRWTYDDQGAWAWGMGIDNFLLRARQSQCGNGRCDPGETPEHCPEDCPYLSPPAPAWIPLGEDLQGRAVTYRHFKGGTRCDDCSEAIDLPFSFEFYGWRYQRVFLNANGNLTFEEPYKIYTPEPFCLEGPSMIAPFFADLDLQHGGEIQYYADPEGHYLIVTWREVPYFGCGADCPLRNTFQAILTDGQVDQVRDWMVPPQATVIFSYGDMQWTTGEASGGDEGLGGSPATVGLNTSSGVVCHSLGTFDRPGYSYYGPNLGKRCPPSAVSYLDHRSFAFDGGTGTALDRLTEPTGTISLQAQPEGEANRLRWESSQPERARYYIVERSTDGEAFTLYQRLAPEQRVLLDEHPLPGLSFYRVQQVNFIEMPYLSEVRSVDRRARNTGSLDRLHLKSVGPNPMRDYVELTYHAPKEGRVSYLLLDMGGRPLLEGYRDTEPGEGHIRLNTARLPAGSYVVSLRQNRQRDTRMVLKQ